MNILLVLVLVAGISGGTYAALPMIQGTLLSEPETESTVPDPVPQQYEVPSSIGQPPADAALGIIDSAMLYRAPSFVVVANSGHEDINLQKVSYGPTIIPLSNLRVAGGEQLKIPNLQVYGTPGTKYSLQVQGVSQTGKLVTAETSATLTELVSRLQVDFSQIDILNANHAKFQLTLRNSGMDSVSVVGIYFDTPIPNYLWAPEGVVLLQPGEVKALTIQLDTLEQVGVRQHNGDGTISYLAPAASSTKLVTIRGENSQGQSVTAFAKTEIAVSEAEQQEQQVEPQPDAVSEKMDLVGTKLPMDQVSIRMNGDGQYTLSLTLVNALTQDVVIDSLTVNGVEIPGWSGSTLYASATLSSTVTSNKGITNFDIGSSVDVIILGHIAGASQYGSPATSVYATSSEQVTG